jgi:hypothetical protein
MSDFNASYNTASYLADSYFEPESVMLADELMRSTGMSIYDSLPSNFSDMCDDAYIRK